jgi:penicillin-binding protein 1C
VHRGQPRTSFAVPDGLIRVEVCADSGLLPKCLAGGTTCAEAMQPITGDADTEVIACPHRRMEYFIPGTEPSEVDRSHVRRLIDVRTGEPATDRTPYQYVVPQTFWLLPPEYAAWAREERLAGIAVAGTPLSPAAPEAGDGGARPATHAAVDNTAPLALVSPDPHRTYRIDPALPVSAQEVPVTVLPRIEPHGEIVLLVDGATYGTLAGPEFTAWWPLAKGRHTFEAVTMDVHGAQVRSGEIVVWVE